MRNHSSLIYIYIIALCSFSLPTQAQIEIVHPDLHQDTKIAPAYFGPSAFPVPDMLDDAVTPTLQVTAAAQYHHGDYSDRSTSALLHLRVPLFTPRANLVLWMPIEHYHLSSEWKEHARIADNPTTKGTEVGTAFVSTDILLMTERRLRPALSLRAAMKTASEDDWTTARYYDCPGYFFDAAIGKGITFEDMYLQRLRLGVSAGFLCWQTDNGRQNDATMYAVEVKARFRHFTLSQDLRGYSGWEGDGDRPMVTRTELKGHFSGSKARRGASRPVFSPFFAYEKGLRDYPYQQVCAGISVDFDILCGQRVK